KIKPIAACALLGCALLGAETMNVKPGKWQTTMTMESSGRPPIPQETLDKMTPQQRQMMEERMKAAMAPRTTTTTSCITKEEIEKGLALGNDDKSCTRTVISSSSSKQEVKIECNREGTKVVGTMRVESLGSETAKGTMQMQMISAGRTMNMNSTFTSKYLSPV